MQQAQTRDQGSETRYDLENMWQNESGDARIRKERKGGKTNALRSVISKMAVVSVGWIYFWCIPVKRTERETEKEKERGNEYPAPTRRRCFARKIRSVPLVGILELFFSPLSFSRPSPCSLSISAAAVTAAYSNAANPSLERSFFPSTWLQRNDGQPCVRFLAFYRRLIIKTNNTGW